MSFSYEKLSSSPLRLTVILSGVEGFFSFNMPIRNINQTTLNNIL
jgi:hypothetical protein